jgi:hypothetical protein
MRNLREDPLEVGNDTAPDGKRTEQVKLMLTRAEAQAIRSSARSAGTSLSQYVVDCHNGRPVRSFDLAAANELAQLRVAMTQVPQSVRDLEADLGRLSGRLASFFSGENCRLAYENQEAINGTIFAVRDLCDAVLPVLAQLQQDMIQPRWEALKILRAISEANRLGRE